MPFQFGDDAAIFDGLETVTVQTGEAEDFSAQALRRPLSAAEQQRSGGLFLPGDVRWHFATATLVVPPAVGTLIVDADGRQWSVVHTDDGVFGTRFSCTARYLGDAP